MNEKKVKDWCEVLTTGKDWPRDDEAIKKLWAPIEQDLTSEEQISLLNCLAQSRYIFRWLNLISYLLPDLLSEDQNFINLIETVVYKVKRDMAQGVFIRSLINIGEKDPERGIELYSRLTEVSSDSAIHYSGLILGGAAKKKFDKVFEIIEKDLQQKKSSVTVACLRALRVAFEIDGEIHFPSRILDILDEMSENKDPSVQIEVIQGYIDFDKFDPERCEKKLLEIATEGNSMARFTIVDRLWFKSLNRQSTEIEILKICVEDNDVNVLEGIARVLSRKGQAFLEDSLTVVKLMLKKPSYLYVPDLGYYLKELCKNEPKSCVKSFQKWLEVDQDPVFRFRLSRILLDIRQNSTE